MTQKQLMEQTDFLQGEAREDGEVRTPEELLTILDKELADMKSKGLA